MNTTTSPQFAIVGGGLGGALLAVHLGKAGYQVDVYEMRGDLRKLNVAGGRSINLALSYRGICALERVGLADEVLASAVRMPGRMVHSLTGRVNFQAYGSDDFQAIHSVSRTGLNVVLLDAADAFENVRLHFHHKCTDVDFESSKVTFTVGDGGETVTREGVVIVGADGAFSRVRRRMQGLDRFNYRQDYLEHGYKELTMPPAADGSFRLEPHALHIWPRRFFMMIALPNADASFTCTLFWPFDGSNGFGEIETESELKAFFGVHFPDAVEHLPTLTEEYFKNPVGSLMTVRCSPWYHQDRVVMIGDACHAVVPFYGQGMNAAFEDVLVLSECIERSPSDLHGAFKEYHAIRKVNVDVLADLAIGNFLEMRDRTGSRVFLFRKKVEKFLHRLLPKWYVPLYMMATFTRMPYTQALKKAKRQERVVRWVAVVGLVLAVLLTIGLMR